MAKFTAGDRVVQVAQNVDRAHQLAERVRAGDVLTIERMMPHSLAERGVIEYETSDGRIHAESELHAAPAVAE
jgi:hypothetical protein